MGIITGLVLMFSFTFSALVFLVRDVDRGISHRAPAQAIAFQAARAGAQQVDPLSLRTGGPVMLRLDPVAAERAARAAVVASLRSDALPGTAMNQAHKLRVLEVTVGADQVEVRVEIHDGTRVATGYGVARSVVGP
jgi:hypothetical protein